jgi:hypothetical protein
MSSTDVVPLYETILVVLAWVALVVGPILFALWGRRRRAHEIAARQADTTKGAESVLYVHGREI